MGRGPLRRIFLKRAVASAAALFLSRVPTWAREPVVHEVRIKAFEFIPDHIEVLVGDTIRWTNDDIAPHTATAAELGWGTKELARGESAELFVQEGMEPTYFCIFHPHMTGTITIQ